MRGQVPLDRDGGRKRISGAAEDGEERVSFSLDLVAAGLVENGADDRVVVADNRRVVGGAQLLQQPRRALDVREHEVTVTVALGRSNCGTVLVHRHVIVTKA